MASKFVRNIREVTDVTKLSDNVTEENDIISQTDGKVFIRKAKGYIEFGGGASSEDVSNIKKDITSIKSEQTKIKNRLDALENPPTE